MESPDREKKSQKSARTDPYNFQRKTELIKKSNFEKEEEEDQDKSVHIESESPTPPSSPILIKNPIYDIMNTEVIKKLEEMRKENKLSDTEEIFLDLFKKMALSKDENMVAEAKIGLDNMMLAKTTSWKVVRLNERVRELAEMPIGDDIKEIMKNALQLEITEAIKHSFRPSQGSTKPSGSSNTPSKKKAESGPSSSKGKKKK